MKKEFKIYLFLCTIIIVLAVLLVASNKEKINSALNSFHPTMAIMRDGSSKEKAIVINVIKKSEQWGVKESEIQIRDAEIKSLSEKFGEYLKDWNIKAQSLASEDESDHFSQVKIYDKYIIIANSEEEVVYFDITDTFNIQKPRVTHNNPVEFYYQYNGKEEYYFDSSGKTACVQSEGDLDSYYKYIDFDKDGADEVYYSCFKGGSGNYSIIYVYNSDPSNPKLIGSFENQGWRDFATDKNNDGFLDIVTYIRDDDSQCSEDNCSNADLLPREVVYFWNNSNKSFATN